MLLDLTNPEARTWYKGVIKVRLRARASAWLRVGWGLKIESVWVAVRVGGRVRVGAR